MPMNHFPSNFPESLWLPAMDPTRIPKSHQNDDESELDAGIFNNERELMHHHRIIHSSFVEQQLLEREPMFEKPLTPSDVGKLNRLVIPKQHAEKYFPLSGDSGNKGLLLSFEDESAKCWRFRYSYWNSSQSYVLTKGWSRYVKEKHLDAGDVILFQRHRADLDRLFIGWRRRGSGSPAGLPPAQRLAGGADFIGSVGGAAGSGSGSGGAGGGLGWTRVFYNAQAYPAHTLSLPYQPDRVHAAGSVMQHQKTSSSSSPAGNSKRLRLFGVNLECQLDVSEPQLSDGSPPSSQGAAYNYFGYPSSHHHHTDISFSQGVNQMGNRLG
ncbi:hypothetical protein Nepgr_011814 [Nepenthes gracilis]|uniref:TF-B3 domain-containing protein n=1 Tax=Nepenthes gracilis TaxID=150966 RepID=A0AAD3XM90_NEPGR|nr:hypothetical protein Nepgr_011814 [Nepenthes gracilis]